MANETYSKKLITIKSQIDETITTVRRMTTTLRPLILDDFGLYAALNWLTTGFEQQTGTQIEVVLPDDKDEPTRGSNISNVLFRIAQESLNNITKHANANHVTLVLEKHTDRWRIQITDDGNGFDALTHHQQGFGLSAMRERTEIMEGQFKIQSIAGKGTRVSAEIPLEAAIS